jgi:bone morphogenetic protein receptor type-2
VSGKQDCHQNACVANKKPPKALNNTKFCCCNSDLCNMNVSDVYVASQADDPNIESPGENLGIFLYVFIFTFSFLFCNVFIIVDHGSCPENREYGRRDLSR